MLSYTLPLNYNYVFFYAFRFYSTVYYYKKTEV